MSIEAAIRDELLNDTAVAALVDTRIYYVIAPSEADYPRITMCRIGSERQLPFSGPVDMLQCRLQLDSWSAANYFTAKELADKIRAVLHGFKGSAGDGVNVHYIKLENEQDDKHPPLGSADDPVFRVIQDYIVWYDESSNTGGEVEEEEEEGGGTETLEEGVFTLTLMNEGTGTTTGE